MVKRFKMGFLPLLLTLFVGGLPLSPLGAGGLTESASDNARLADTPRLPVGSIRIDNEAPGEPQVVISRMAASVSIQGGTALTRLDLTLHNQGSQVRGANLVIPLLADALIMGYQLEVEGVLIDGVPVERVQARQIYETIQRQGIDPGLAEYAQGNAFRTRVFPIGPFQSRRMTLSFLSPLGGEKASLFELPLSMGGKVAQFELDLKVLEAGAAPQVELQGLGEAVFQPLNRGWFLKVEKKDLVLSTVLKVELPQGGLDQVVYQTVGKQTWFSFVTAVGAADKTQAHPQGGYHLFVDGSLSMGKAQPTPLLEALKALAATEKNPLNLRVQAFRDQPGESAVLQITPTDASQLSHWLDKLDWDGGTRFDNLPTPPPGSLVLFYTDADPSLGQALPPWMGSQRGVILSPGSLSHADFARRLLGPQGFTADLGAWKPADLARAILSPSARTLEIKVLQGRADEIRQAPLFGRSDLVTVSGLMASDSLSLELKTQGQTRVIAVDLKQGVSGETARYLWAQAQLQTLLSRSDYGTRLWKEEVRSFGLEYGVVTPGTSLLVLESLSQYQEFNIMPPASMPQWRQAFVEQNRKSTQQKQDSQKERLESLAAQWEQRIAWWKTDLRNAVWKPSDSAKEGAESPATRSENRDEAERPLSPQRESAPDLAGAASPIVSDDEKSEAKKSEEEAPSSSIEIQAWSPDRPYLKQLEGLTAPAAYQKYLKLRDEYRGSPAFFLDMGDFFVKLKSPSLAARIWTNLAELGFKDPAVLRVLGHRLDHAGDLDLATLVLEMVLEIRPDEPQSHRDLGLTLARRGDFARGAQLLWTVVSGEWRRTPGIELIALMELNRYLPQARKQGFAQKIDPRLEKALDLDLRISLAWDSDLTDMDLWVTEPSGYKVYYGEPASPHGGLVSRDITDGYGPEEYLLHWAKSGEYKITAHYFGSSSPELTGAVSLYLSLWTNYGRPNEERKDIILQLGESDDEYFVGSVKWK